jgi:ATP-binding cassette, subfamily B, bacterial MsbA
VRDFMIGSWRARLAVVPQDVYLFNASVRENIAYGRGDVSDAEIEAAARAAQAHEFIAALPHGYDTRVGERGVRFSGGQRQRIALARAIVRDPDILILDEATNALDSLSERLVRDAVNRVGANRTMLIIAHRMASVEHADQVIVLDRGRIIEVGPPSLLADSGGLYAQLHEAERLSA